MESPSFLDHLKISGLLADEQIAEVSGRFSNSAMQIVVSDLVGQGLLTAFQVKQLHAGQPKGLVLGQYHLLDELGRGGYGCVYKARHKLMNRIVALKVIAPERVEDSRARAWFRREVLAATQLAHPNIVLAYDADEIDEILFFAMEFIDGLNLDALLRERGPLPIGTACEMLLQTAKALQYAHEKGMVHRDIKPANLLIPRSTMADAAADFSPQTFAGSARPVLIKVVDFGLARLQSSSSNNTLVLQNERGFVGTPAYVSPEQARNVHEVDIRSDLYSLGCTFYHALAGRPPFQASNPLQVVVQHLEKEPEPIERLRPEIPSALASIIRRLMAKQPEKRFQTPGELLGELGFFYTLDRSGVQRSLPFLGSSLRALPAAPLAEDPVPAARYSSDRLAEESNYEATCQIDHAVERRPAAPDATDRLALSTPAAVTNPTEVVNHEAATATSVMPKPATPALPAEKKTPIVDRELMRRWQEWLRVLDDLAVGRAPALSPSAYRVLHRELLEACQSHASDPRVQQVAEAVRPWLTLSTLAGIDRESLASLQKRCHALASQLGPVGRGSWLWALGLLVLLLIGGGSYFLMESVGNIHLAHISWSTLIQRNPLISLAVVAPVGLLAVALLLKTLTRVPHAK